MDMGFRFVFRRLLKLWTVARAGTLEKNRPAWIRIYDLGMQNVKKAGMHVYTEVGVGDAVGISCLEHDDQYEKDQDEQRYHDS